MSDKEILSVGFAVFNGHVNDADKKARAIMQVICPDKLARVEEIEEEGNGIMHIFNVEPEPATLVYCGMVAGIVNADRVEV